MRKCDSLVLWQIVVILKGIVRVLPLSKWFSLYHAANGSVGSLRSDYLDVDFAVFSVTSNGGGFKSESSWEVLIKNSNLTLSVVSL